MDRKPAAFASLMLSSNNYLVLNLLSFKSSIYRTAKTPVNVSPAPVVSTIYNLSEVHAGTLIISPWLMNILPKVKLI